jgi:hypothetical protein
VHVAFICCTGKGMGVTSFVRSSASAFYGIRCHPKAVHICSCLSFASRVTDMSQGMEHVFNSFVFDGLGNDIFQLLCTGCCLYCV